MARVEHHRGLAPPSNTGPHRRSSVDQAIIIDQNFSAPTLAAKGHGDLIEGYAQTLVMIVSRKPGNPGTPGYYWLWISGCRHVRPRHHHQPMGPGKRASDIRGGIGILVGEPQFAAEA
jgi:hypothetical protein